MTFTLTTEFMTRPERSCGKPISVREIRGVEGTFSFENELSFFGWRNPRSGSCRLSLGGARMASA